MASFGDILSSLGRALETGGDYGMSQMGAGGMSLPQAQPQPQPKYQDDTRQPLPGAPGTSRLNLLQYLLGLHFGGRSQPPQPLAQPDGYNFLGRIGPQ